MKTYKIGYWASTGFIAVFMLFSSFMYLSKNPQMMESAQKLGLPIYFITMLGIAKFLGVISLVQQKWRMLQEWAYAGFFFTFMGAVWTHLSTETPFIAPVIELLIVGLSYWFRHKLSIKPKKVIIPKRK